MVFPIFSLTAELDQYYGDIYSLIIGFVVYTLAKLRSGGGDHTPTTSQNPHLLTHIIGDI